MQSAEVQQGESQHFDVVGIAWLINASSWEAKELMPHWQTHLWTSLWRQ